MSFSIETLNCIDDNALKYLYELSLSYFEEYESYDKANTIEKLTKEHIGNYFSAFLKRQDRRASIARMDDRIVGYITYYEKKRQCFYKIQSIGDISGLFVQKEYRNKGIGKGLMNCAITFFKTRRIQYYSLFTSINDKKAIEYFKKNGMYENNVVLHGNISTCTEREIT